jgi:polyphosphate kinase
MGKNKQKEHESAKAVASSGEMSRKEFEKELANLQVELVRLQTWVQAKKASIIVVFEGRDTAGKGGVISRITARTSPRVYRHVALPTPSDREKTQIYFQRYMAHFPAAGEIILFDRSWYNRAGVERVMGFCNDEQYERFLEMAPVIERQIIRNGVILIKYFLDVSQDEQRRRFEARINEPIKHPRSPRPDRGPRVRPRVWARASRFPVTTDLLCSRSRGEAQLSPRSARRLSAECMTRKLR